jgi:AraC-like DNA-binding protein/mannose-6-phosphate isomerase-like protein (cupin superfamily)
MTEPSYRLIAPQANRSFVFKWEPFGLTTRWHYHPEIELIFFVEGETSAVIGDSFQHFKEGDLVILGANFPHVLQENREYARQHPNHKPFGLIMQFTEEFLGKEFLNKPELLPVKILLQKAGRGLHFRRDAVEKVTATLLQMHQLNESRKLLSLLEILVTLSEDEAFDYLTPKGYKYDSGQDEERMHNIHQYVYEHFTETITIKKIAFIANMTETSFCRYFKTRTLKHFTQFVNEIRIAYSCRLLNNNNYSVTHACFESGFNNLSYFNRQFKQVMKVSPQHYQKWKKAAVN